MIRSTIRRTVVLSVATCFLALPIMQTAQAAIIPTNTAIDIADRERQINDINELLAQESVRSIMIRLGVDPADASARVRSLTAGELQKLEDNLADLPAGGVGVVETIGIVAIVLIVLELLHVTNFFSEF